MGLRLREELARCTPEVSRTTDTLGAGPTRGPPVWFDSADRRSVHAEGPWFGVGAPNPGSTGEAARWEAGWREALRGDSSIGEQTVFATLGFRPT